MKTLIACIFTFTLAGPSAFAHDYWLQPDKFFVAAKAPATLRLYLGHEGTNVVERPYQKKMTLRFELVSADSTRDLKQGAKNNAKPARQIKSLPAGTHWAVLKRDVSHITLKPAKFTSYLKHEGLERIIKARAEAGESKKAGRERYGRYLKCLLQAGDKRDDTWKRVLKLKLEIVPLSNPASLKPGGSLQVRVLFEGQPLPGSAIFCIQKSDGKATMQSTKTDKAGVAKFAVKSKGAYLVRLVHMRRTKSSKRADWESFWGAMAFGVR